MQMATRAKKWTLAELHSLPDDGNKYELVHGELFVTPPPSEEHETIAARLARILDPYVAANELGFVYRPRAVVRFKGSEAEPDLMVRQPKTGRGRDWDNAPIPTLLVEVLSGSTRRRDLGAKREFYLEVGIPEYWIVDPDRREVRVVRMGREDELTTDRLVWTPRGATESLVVSVPAIFGAQTRDASSES
jgi:Uma2 family endonuclease